MIFDDTINFDFSDPINIALLVVGLLIVVVAIISLFVSIYLAIRYIKYNRKHNSLGLTGEEIARQVLDKNDLSHIRVKCTGSLLFGNSYSHYFKKVRLRRLTWKKQSVTSLAMATEKASLAVLDKEGDPDMKMRVRLVPIITFGPFAFIPLLAVGILIDFIFFETVGLVTLIAALLGLAFYVGSFVLSIMVYKTEVKAQGRALEIAETDLGVTSEELSDMKELYRLYNIQYINDMVLAFLEMLYRILQIVAQAKGGSFDLNKK